MKTRERRKPKEEVEDGPVRDRSDAYTVRRDSVAMEPPRRLTGAPSRPTEDERLEAAINAALREIDDLRLEAHVRYEEMERVGQETRRLIAEMQRDLNLKAA